MNCYTCRCELPSGISPENVHNPNVPISEQAILCVPCRKIVRQIADAFGEAAAQICRLARQGGFQ